MANTCRSCHAPLTHPEEPCLSCERTLVTGSPLSSAPDEPVALPAELAGRYEVLEELGRGGMGVVLLARDLRLDRVVALKLLRMASPEAAQLFEREAQVLAALENENVVRVYDYAIASGTPVLVMEYVRGLSLSAHMAACRPTIAEAVQIVRDVLRGLAAAHARGIVHRDVKPGNVFLDERGRAKVADFGLARRLSLPPIDGAGPVFAFGADSEPASLTAGWVVGTPGYMSPEQLHGDGDVGPKSDLYAIGVVLHEALTGQRLFQKSDLVELARAQFAGPPAPPSCVRPGVPAALDALTRWCLAVDPDARPDAGQAIAALDAWLATVKPARPGALPPEPYRFVAAFEERDAPVFFGRDAELAELSELLARPEVRVVSLFGPGGIGKSSLVAAGLVPLARQRGGCVVLRPGADGVRALHAALTADPAVLVLDQLEEVFTHNPPGSPRGPELLEAIERLATDDARPLQLVLSYRTEFRGELFALEERLGPHARAMALRGLTRAGLLEAMTGPAQHEGYGFSFDPDLAEALADELLAGERRGGERALPVLQIVCGQLYRALRAGGGACMDRALFDRALSGTRGALARHVEEVLADPRYRDARGMARQILKALTVKDGAERFARAVEEAELTRFPDPAAARQVLARLSADRLVATEVRPDGTRLVRLASEVLCPLIDAWLVEPDAAERAARALARAHRQWADHGRRDEDLPRGATLALIERQRNALRDLSAGEVGLIARAVSHRRRRRAMAAALLLLAMTLTGSLAWAAFLRPGAVLVTTHPPGATVSRDGVVLGVTPYRLESRPGRQVLSLASPRHTTTALDVLVPAGGEAAYHAVLPYPYGRLSVSTAPEGARCAVLSGTTTASVMQTPFTTELPAGNYRLALTLNGHVPREVASVEVLPNRERRALSLPLARDTGRLVVHSPFEGARLELFPRAGGPAALSATLPLETPAELASGTYTARVSGPQRTPWERPVTIARDATTTLTAWSPPHPPRWAWPRTEDGHPLAATGTFVAGGESVPAPALAHLTGDAGWQAVIAQADGTVAALDAADGRVRWTAKLPAPPAGPPSTVSTGVLCVATDGTLRAFATKTGSVLWTAHLTGTPVGLAVSCDDGDAVAVTREGCVTAFETATGKARWTSNTGATIIAAPGFASITAFPAMDVIVPTAQGVRALAAVDGHPLWSSPRFVADSQPASRFTFVAVSGADGKLRILKQRDGSLLEEHSTGVLAGPPVLGMSVVVYATRSGNVVRQGPAGWSVHVADALHAAPAVVDVDGDGEPDVVVACPDGRVVVLAGRDGRVVTEVSANGIAFASTPVVADLDRDGFPEVLVRGPAQVTLALPRPAETVRWAWQAERPALGAKLDMRPPWTVVADLDGDAHADVCVALPDGRVQALAGADGAPLWTSPVLAPALVVPPAVADLDGDGRSEVVVGTLARELAVLAPGDGHVAAHVKLPAACRAPPLVFPIEGTKDLAIVLGLSGEVRAFSGAALAPLWQRPVGGAKPALLALAPRAGTSPAVCVAMLDGSVAMLESRDGKVLWRRAGIGPLVAGAELADLDGDGIADPVVAALEGRVTALSGKDGHPLWSLEVGDEVQRPPLVVDVDGDGAPDVVVSTAGAKLVAIEGRTGRGLWQAESAIEIAELLVDDLDGDGKPDLVGAGAHSRIFGLGLGAPGGPRPLFALDAQLTGHIGTAALDPARFRTHGRVLWSGGQPAPLPGTRAPGSPVEVLTLRTGPAVVVSTLARSRDR